MGISHDNPPRILPVISGKSDPMCPMVWHLATTGDSEISSSEIRTMSECASGMINFD